MKVAALYDIHGNLPALEAVLEEVQKESVDLLVVGGDVFPGPMSNQALACLLALDVPIQFIRGNGDREVLAWSAGEGSESTPESFQETLRWEAEGLRPGHKEVLEQWPETFRREIPGLGNVLFCHATPRSDVETFTRLTLEDRLLETFEDTGASLVVCGHTHMPFDRMVGRVRVVNAGSVGMPFGQPGGHWLLLGPGVEPRVTHYDLEEAARRIRATDYPQAEGFAANNVLQCPTEKKMLELFS
ncbi:MAG: metallophosphatase family protein [Deltaproteobacteria bacterium]|nr:metallophosphatase family protein [Deltaproteobacteria bacterium]